MMPRILTQQTKENTQCQKKRAGFATTMPITLTVISARNAGNRLRYIKNLLRERWN